MKESIQNDEVNRVLEQEKQAVEDAIAMHWLTPENTVFARTSGGFVRLQFAGKDYPRVAVHRCFPFSDPARYISIREPEGEGREIGLIADLREWPADTRTLLEEQMNLRYFMPKIRRIVDIKEEYGYSYWQVQTDRGACRFTVRMGAGSVYAVGPNRYVVNDLDGNRFEIPDLYQLTPREVKKLDLFI